MSRDQDVAISRLAKLPAEDRQWLYGQLSADERARLAELLSRDAGARAANAAKTGESEFPPAEERAARASGWQVTQALIDEPEWMLALVLSRRSWPWSADYLDGMDVARHQRVHALIPSVRKASREAAYRAAIKALADKIERVLPDTVERKSLEVGVARLMDVRPMDD